MVVLGVEPDALLDMAGRLKGLQVEFDGAGGHMDGAGGAVGFPDLEHELHTFATNWSDKRRTISDMITDVAAAAEFAADAYAELESSLTEAFAPSGY